jgi:Tfp pilus assembly protein PilN
MLINLISARRAEKRKLRAVADTIIRVQYAAAIVTILAVTALAHSSRTLAVEAAKVEAQATAYEAQAQEVRSLRAAEEAMKPRVQLIERTELNINRWRYLLAQAADAVPPGVQIDSFAVKAANGSAQSFDLTCRAVDVYTAARFYARLEAEPDVASVQMHGGNWQGNQVAFQITITLIQPPGQAMQGAAK